MEFELVPQLIVVFSAATIVFILGKNISKAENISVGNSFIGGENENEARKKFFYLYKRLVRRINKEEYQKKIGLFWIWLEKVLRKIRIGFLKLDSKIVSLLDRLRKKNTAGNATETKTKVEDKNEKEKKNIEANNFVSDKTIDGERKNNTNLSAKNKKENEINTIGNEIKIEKKDEVNAAEDRAKTEKEREYINLISRNPFDVKSYWKLGVIYSRRKNYTDAVSCFRQIIKIDPTYAKAKKKISDLMERMKKRHAGGRQKDDKKEDVEKMPT